MPKLYLYVPFATEFVKHMADNWQHVAQTQQHKEYEIIQYSGKSDPTNLKDVKAGDTVYILCHGDPAHLRFADRTQQDGGTAQFLPPPLLAKRVLDDGLPNVALRLKLYACEANTSDGMMNLAQQFVAGVLGQSLQKYRTADPKFTIFGYSKSVSNPMPHTSDGEVHKRGGDVVQVGQDDEAYVVTGRAKAYRQQLYP